MTYSINTGTSIQATVYNIIGATAVDLSPVLNALHDNTSKEISPEVIRNSILTSWSSSAFKQTQSTQSSIYYIGVDNGNYATASKDVKSKIFLGKRSYSGTYSYSLNHDIMTSNMLNRLDDVFLFNTKKDSVTNYRTRVSILAGTKSSLFTDAPYIQSQIVTVGTYSSLSLDLINPTLNGGTYSVLNINSVFGTASINNIVFPTIQNSSTNSGDGKILSWNNGNLVWDIASFSATSYIGVTGSAINIYGTPVSVNGYSLEFTESRPCPIQIGDIKFGETFTNESIGEMLRRIIYPYLPPLCTLSLQQPYTSGYVEVGSSPLIKLDYTITKRSLPTQTSILSYMIPSSYPVISTPGKVVISGSASGVIVTPVTSATTSFYITVSDGTQSNSATASVKGIYPYFYGFSSVNPITTAGLASLSKLVEAKSNKTVEIYGSGNLYFMYDSDYPLLNSILDEFGNNITGSFSSSLVTLSSPTGLWASKQFRVYQWNSHPLVSPSVNYQFKY